MQKLTIETENDNIIGCFAHAQEATKHDGFNESNMDSLVH